MLSIVPGKEKVLSKRQLFYFFFFFSIMLLMSLCIHALLALFLSRRAFFKKTNWILTILCVDLSAIHKPRSEFYGYRMQNYFLQHYPHSSLAIICS